MSESEAPAAASRPMLIVGMHGSGTSVLAEILQHGGLFLGIDAPHHENRFFRDEVNEGIVLGSGSRWAELPLPSEAEVAAFEPAVRRLVERHWAQRFRTLGWDGRSPWGFKDPRTCLLLPLYLRIFPAACVLHIVRDPEDVATGLAHRRKQGVGRLRDREHWRRLTLAYQARVRQWAEGHPDSYHEVSYERLCREPRPVLNAVFEFVGIAFGDAQAEFAEARLHTGRIGLARRGALAWRLSALRSALFGRR